jgi:hypothetical protein
MKFRLDLLAKHDRLTNKELPGLQDDEFIVIRSVRDYILDGEAASAAWAELRQEAENLKQPPPTELPNVRLWRWWFEYMFVDWNLYEPADDETQTHGEPIPKTPEQRDLFFRIYGAELTAAMLMRGGSIAGRAVRKTGPDGNPPSF